MNDIRRILRDALPNRKPNLEPGSGFYTTDRELRELLDDLESLDRERMSLEQFARKYRIAISPREPAEEGEE